MSSSAYRDEAGSSLDGGLPGGCQKFENGCLLLASVYDDGAYGFSKYWLIYTGARADNISAVKLFSRNFECLIKL